MKKFSVECNSREEYNMAQTLLLKMGYIWNKSKQNKTFDLFAFNSHPNFPIIISCGHSKDGCLTFDDDVEETKRNDESDFYGEYGVVKCSVFCRKEKLKIINEI